MMKSSTTYEDIMKNWNNREDNPLKDAYHVKVESIDQMENVVKEISKIEGVHSVKNNEDMEDYLDG